MSDSSRQIYCAECESLAGVEDRFCGVCGARIPPAVQEAAPTERIPVQVQPPPAYTRRGNNRTVATVVGIVILVLVSGGRWCHRKVQPGWKQSGQGSPDQ